MGVSRLVIAHNSSKKIGDGPINVVPSKTKTKLLAYHELINRNDNIYYHACPCMSKNLKCKCILFSNFAHKRVYKV